MNPIEVKVGEFGEGYPWNIHFDYETLYFPHHNDVPCKHSVNIRREEGVTNIAGNTHYIHFYTVPRSIECTNEGGTNHTMLCLDCLLETLEDNGIEVSK